MSKIFSALWTRNEIKVETKAAPNKMGLVDIAHNSTDNRFNDTQRERERERAKK